MVFLKGRDSEERARDSLLEIRDPFLGPPKEDYDYRILGSILGDS